MNSVPTKEQFNPREARWGKKRLRVRAKNENGERKTEEITLKQNGEKGLKIASLGYISLSVR